MGNYVEIKNYKGYLSKLKNGLEEVKQGDLNIPLKKYSPKGSKNSVILENNWYRSYSQMLEYAFTNAKYFKTFTTLTFKDNIKDLDYANREFNKTMKAIRRIYPNFKYLGVPEFQKRGAVHYHLMTNIEIDDVRFIKKQLNKNNMYDFILWTNGYTSVYDLKLADDKFSVGLYLSKYFFKDKDNRLFGRNKILKSNNLEKAKTFLLIEQSDEYVKYIAYLENNYELKKEKNIVSANTYVPDFVVKLYKLI